MRPSQLWVAAAALLLLTGSASAQPERNTGPQRAQPSDQSACPPGSRNTRPDETTGSRPLGEQLSESKGVICPPSGVDPGISVPPTGGGRTPVIPPPGTPGGDQNVQPK